MSGGVSGIVGPPLLRRHVLDQEHLSGPARVQTRPVAALILQLVSVQRYLAVVSRRERLVATDQRYGRRFCPWHRASRGTRDVAQHVVELTIDQHDAGQILMQSGEVVHRWP